MSKESQFEEFKKTAMKLYDIDDGLLVLLEKTFHVGYAAGYSESVNEVSVFIKNQVDSFYIEFGQQK